MKDLDTEKLGIKTFTVQYEDDTKDIIKPVSWRSLDDVQILQYEILEACRKSDGSIGDLLNPKNTDFWDPATKLAALMPTVGSSSQGIKIDKIEDCELLIDIFVTTTKTRDPETGFISPGESVLLPSLISRINGVNFLRLLLEMQKSQMKKMAKSTSLT